jgi:hypothetical protein
MDNEFLTDDEISEIQDRYFDQEFTIEQLVRIYGYERADIEWIVNMPESDEAQLTEDTK